jgi:peptidoglycan/LPS O-acetylase OafA/YrhL
MASIENKELSSLLGLRGIAAAMVVIFHYEQLEQFRYVSDATMAGVSLRQLVEHGYLWVDLFFALSGYLLYKRDGCISLRSFRVDRYLDFVLRRFARTVPLYIGSLTIVLLVWCLETVHDTTRWPSEMFTRPISTVVANVLLVQAWGLAPSLNSPSWSLSVEWLLYLTFPVLSSIIALSSRTAAARSALVLSSMFLILFYTDNSNGLPLDFHDYFEPRTLMRGAASFMLGGLISRAEFNPVHHSIFLRPWTASCVALIAILLMASKGTELLIVSAFATLIYALVMSSYGFVQKVLSGRYCRIAGRLSYSVYLLHDQFFAACSIVRDRFNYELSGPLHAILLIVSMIALYAGAALCYISLEQPARTLILKRRPNQISAAII